ncbi:tetratricopeptide repeat protein [Streptomyces chartreusis]
MAGLAVLATAPALLATFKVTNQWAVGIAVVGAAVLVAVAAVWQERYKRAVQQRDERALKIENGCLVLPNGRLPKVAQAADPLRLGVHPAPILAVDPTEHAANGATERVPVYVPRDIDDELRERLARGGFVLLVGDSTAGKSRAAYEAMAATLRDHVLVAPQDRAAVPTALAQAAEERRCVLWLSDLEQYLGAGGLTRTGIARVLGGTGHHRVILASLRAAEQARLTDGPTTQDEAGRVAYNEAREVLEQAHQLRVRRVFSTAEKERARARDWDPRIADALHHTDTYGIAEYIAAGPDLLRNWQDAWSPNTDPDAPTHPRAAALIAAAVDIRRAGHTAPLPRRLLEATHEHYLTQRGGNRLRELGQLTEAETELRAVLDTCTRELGPEHPTTLTSRNNLALALRDLGQLTEAETELRAVLNLRTRVLGPEHPNTLTSRNSRAHVWRELGQLTEAETELRAVLDTCTRVLGPEHPITLTSRNNLALALRDLGQLTEAETELRAVLNLRTRVLGPEHPNTLTSRGNLAKVVTQMRHPRAP